MTHANTSFSAFANPLFIIIIKLYYLLSNWIVPTDDLISKKLLSIFKINNVLLVKLMWMVLRVAIAGRVIDGSRRPVPNGAAAMAGIAVRVSVAACVATRSGEPRTSGLEQIRL